MAHHPYDYFGNRVRNPILEHERRVRYGVHLRFALRDRYNPLDLSVEAFVELYRMPQDVFLRLYHLLEPLAEQRPSNKRIPFHLRLLCALFYFATGSYQEHTGTAIYHPVSQSSVCNIIEEVTNLLNHPQILPKLVRFPWSHEERAATIEINSRLGLPGVLGLVDGTLIPVFPPIKPNQHYYCRKRFTALNAMIVCDVNLKILHVDARYPGSSHDAFVYRWGPLRAAMQRAYQQDHCWLLGDSGYPNEPWLMTPIPDAPRGTPEFNYTKLHCQCRNPVERCIGVLKARFRCLFTLLHYSPQKAGKIINACAGLHNFLTDHRVAIPVDYANFLDGPDPDNLVNEEVVGRLALAQVQEADANRAYLVEHAQWFRNR